MSMFVTLRYNPSKLDPSVPSFTSDSYSSPKKLVTVIDGQSETTNPKTNSVELTPSKMVTFKFETRAKSREMSKTLHVSPTKKVFPLSPMGSGGAGSSPATGSSTSRLSSLYQTHGASTGTSSSSSTSSPQNGNSASVSRSRSRSRSSTPPHEFRRSETPDIENSLAAMSMYHHFSIDDTKDPNVLELEWFGDLKQVAQRLHFLRESYRLIQSIHRKKIDAKENATEATITEDLLSPSASGAADKSTAQDPNESARQMEDDATDVDADAGGSTNTKRTRNYADHHFSTKSLLSSGTDLQNLPSISVTPLASEIDLEEDLNSSQTEQLISAPAPSAGGRKISLTDSPWKRRNSGSNTLFHNNNINNNKISDDKGDSNNDSNIDSDSRLEIGSFQDNDDSMDGSSAVETPM